MRADAWTPRTWVLAAVAGWAVLVALLAVFGLGGRITPLPADPALVQALPRLPAMPPERLGPLPQYAEIGGRTLFSENRQPQPFFISGEGEAAAPGFDMVLSSVLITPRLQLAIVQPVAGGEGLRVKMGEAPNGFPGWRLVELEARRAVFEGPEGRRELALRVFDGTGGAAPTPMATGAPGGVPAAVPMAVPPPAGIAPPRSTGGNSPAAVMPTTPSPPMATPAGTARPGSQPLPAAATEAPAQTTEQQMDAIRQRIEARRAQMRQQDRVTPTPPPASPGKTQ
jgi:general secretion pathway protein N